MGKRTSHRRSDANRAEMMAAYWDEREDELLDAVVTAVALVARADGRIDPAERCQLLDFLDRKGVLSAFTPGEILEMFERQVRELSEPHGSLAALKQLSRHAERSLARVIINAGQEIAAADCGVDSREQHVLQLIWIALGGPLPAPVTGSHAHRRAP